MKVKILIFTFFTYLITFGQAYDFSNLDQLTDSINAHDAMSVVIAIDKEGKNIYQKAIGQAQYSPEIKHTSNSEFKIGSISKTYTATLALLLEQEGKLSLTDKLAKYYPQINGAYEISLDQMLHHRSGLPNYTDQVFFGQNVFEEFSHQQIIDSLKNRALLFKPGEKFEYSNTNYLFMGYIIEDVMHKPFAEVLKQYIFEPNEIVETRMFENDTLSGPYSFMAKQTVPSWNSSWSAAAGGLVSTASEVNTFYYLLFNNKIINPESLKKMTQFQDSYGLGLMEKSFDNHKTYLHSGGIENFHSLTVYVPEEQINFTILSNENDSQIVDNNEIAKAILSDLFNTDYQITNFTKNYVEVSVNDLQKWEGNYTSAELPLEISIFVDENQLYGQATGQGAFPLNCIDENQALFEFSSAGIRMQFENKNDKTLMNFKQGGKEMVFVKGEKVQTSKGQWDKINKEILNQLYGNYSSAELPIDLKIFQQNDQLYAQGSGQAAFPLECTQADALKFEFAPASISLQFILNDDQTQLNFNQAGKSFIFTKE